MSVVILDKSFIKISPGLTDRFCKAIRTFPTLAFRITEHIHTVENVVGIHVENALSHG